MLAELLSVVTTEPFVGFLKGLSGIGAFAALVVAFVTRNM